MSAIEQAVYDKERRLQQRILPSGKQINNEYSGTLLTQVQTPEGNIDLGYLASGQLGHESLASTAIYTHVAIEPLRQMFKMCHPREISLKAIHKVPSPDKIISKLKGDQPPPDAPQPPFPTQGS